jgi:hypothetical protein
VFAYLRSLAALFILCLAIPAFSQRTNTAVPFLKPGTSARSAALVVNPEAVEALRQTTESVSISGVPLVTGATADFALQPAQIFADDARVLSITGKNTSISLVIPELRGWYGTDPEQPGTSAFISADKANQLHVMILGDARTSVTVITPDRTATDGSYRIEANKLPDIPFCNGDALLPPGAATSPFAHTRDIRSTTLYDIELSLDISYDLYRQLGRGGEDVIDYLADLFGGINLIYRRDLQANWVVKYAHIWTVPDPFSSTDRDSPANPALTTTDQLLNFQDYVQANRTLEQFDIAHLLDTKDGLGGLAYVNILGSGFQSSPQYRTGVSNVYGTDAFPSDINTYYWDTMVVAHELGHNVGSPHTHCYEPPIDCCSVQAGCSGCATASAAAGTIMSYCHLWIGSGGSIIMQFHSRCIELMRPLIEASPILSVHPTGSDLRVIGVGEVTVIGTTPNKTTTLRSFTVGGPTVTQTFTIESSGDSNLVLTGTPPVTITGSPTLTIISQPSATVLTPGQKTTFVVSYNPTLGPPVTSTVLIPTNRTVTPTYSFVVAGQNVQQSTPVSATFNGNTVLTEGYWIPTTFEIVGVAGWTSDVDVKFNGTAGCATPGLSHNFVGDLVMVLESPEGTQVTLMNHPGPDPYGAGGANFCNTVIDDSASQYLESIVTGGAPYTGSYKPVTPLATLIGERPNGFWTLYINDPISPDVGTLRSVTLTVRGESLTAVDNWSLYE